MRISVFYDHITQARQQTGRSLLQLLEACKGWGIDGLEINYTQLQRGGFLLLRDIRRAGMSVSCIYEFYDFTHHGDLKPAKKHVDLAAKVGAGRVLIVPGFLEEQEARELEACCSGREPGGSSREPGGSGQEPEGSSREPGGSGQEPEGSGREPEGSSREPEGSGREPGGSGQEPEGSGREPEGSNREPGGSGQEPDDIRWELETGFQEREGQKAECGRQGQADTYTAGFEAVARYMESHASTCQVRDSLRELVDYGQKKGVKITLEDFDSHTSPCARMLPLKWLLEQVPGLGFTLDMGNFAYSGEDVSVAYELLQGYIAHVHCKDRGMEEQGLACVPVGDGYLPVRKLAERLKTQGYDGYLAIEHFDAPDQMEYICRSAEFLRTIVR